MYPDEPNKIKTNIQRIYSSTILSEENIFNQTVTPCIIKLINLSRTNNEIDLSDSKKIINMYYLFKNDNHSIFQCFIDKLDEDSENINRHAFLYHIQNTSILYDKQKEILEKLIEPEDVKNNLKKLFISTVQIQESDFTSEPNLKISQLIGTPQLSWLVNTYITHGFSIEPLYEAISTYVQKDMTDMIEHFHENDQIELNPRTFNYFSQLIDRLSFLIDEYSKVFVTEEAQKKLNEKVRESWNKESLKIPFRFAQYIDYLARNVICGIDDEKEHKIYENIARFFSFFDDKYTASLYYDFYFCLHKERFGKKYEIQDYNVIRSIRKVYERFIPNYDYLHETIIRSNDISNDFKDLVENDPRINPEIKKKAKNFTPLIYYNCPYEPTVTTIENPPDFINDLSNQFTEFFRCRLRHRNMILQANSTVELILSIEETSKSCAIVCDLLVGKLIYEITQRNLTFREIKAILEVPPNPTDANDDVDDRRSSEYRKKLTIAQEIIICLLGRTPIMNALIKIGNPRNTAVNDDDEFSLNTKFIGRNNNTRIVIPSFYHANMQNKIKIIAEEKKKKLLKNIIGRILLKERILSQTELINQVIQKCSEDYIPEEREIRNLLDNPNLAIREIRDGAAFYLSPH